MKAHIVTSSFKSSQVAPTNYRGTRHCKYFYFKLKDGLNSTQENVDLKGCKRIYVGKTYRRVGDCFWNPKKASPMKKIVH